MSYIGCWFVGVLVVLDDEAIKKEKRRGKERQERVLKEDGIEREKKESKLVREQDGF